MEPLLSVSDAVMVLRGLGYGLTARQVRYLGLMPARRAIGLNGGRLFDASDLALLAVFAELLERCRRWELPVWSARAALRYREGELRRAIVRRTPRYLVIDPVTGTTALSETADGPRHALDLRTLVQRVSAAVAAHRAQYPEVWTGSAYVEDGEDVLAVAM